MLACKRTRKGPGVSSLITGLGLGVLAMYLWDPRLGRRRRVRIQHKLTRMSHNLEDGVGKAARDAGNRARGARAQLLRLFASTGPDEHALCERVRSRIGRVCSHPGAIDVIAEGDHVTLKGDILQSEYRRVVQAAETTPGVDGLSDELAVHSNPDHVPALQGSGKRRHPAMHGWRPATRFVVGCASLALGVKALGRRTPVRPLWTAVAAFGLARSLTNMSPRQLFGAAATPRGIEVHKTLNINAPVHEVFDYFDRFENFPRFMTHIKDVKAVGDNEYKWKVTGPADSTFEITARVLERKPGSLIAWASTPESRLQTAGRVRFEARDPGTTRLTVRLVYDPPAGPAGHAIARLLGADPRSQMDDDLLRLKSLIEDGRATGRRGRVRREDVVRH